MRKAGNKDQARGGAALWTPDRSRRVLSNLARFADFAREWGAPKTLGDHGKVDYPRLHRWSIEQPASFWTAVWKFCGVVSDTGPVSRTMDPAALEAMTPPDPQAPRWFPDATLNVAENLLQGPDHQVVLIAWDETGPRSTWTRGQLRKAVTQFADGLRAVGVQPGDRIAGFLPTTPVSVVAFLGTASIGATWTSCSPDFGTSAVLDRFGQTAPKVLVGADKYVYKGKTVLCLDRVKEIADALPSVECVVIAHDREDEGADLSHIPNGVDLRHFGDPEAPLIFPQFPFDHPLAILYSSGTTGLPKCIVHGAGGTLLQHLKELALHTDLNGTDRFFYFTTCGWMMWNWLLSGLATGAALVLYSGAPHARSPEPKDSDRPDAPDMLWTMAEEVGITVFGASAKYLALMEKQGVRPRESHDLSTLRTLLSTGSPLSPQSFRYVYRDISPTVHLASISGGTDIVSCFVLGVPTSPVFEGEIQAAGLGMSVEAWGPDGTRVTGEPGELVCTRPFPSMPIGFWNDPDGQRYRSAYFDAIPGVWRHGDWVEESPRGGWIIYGRSDATLNPGGVRIGTAEIYRQVEAFDQVVEAVAVGRDVRTEDGEQDVEIVLFVRLAPGVDLTDELEDQLRLAIRTGASPHHVPRAFYQAPDFPRTVSGKLSEIAVRRAIHGQPIDNRGALANPESLAFFEDLANS